MSFRSQVAVGLGILPERVRAVVPHDQRADIRHWLGRHLAWEEGFDLTPPPRRAGETVGPPDFIGVGVQQAGARWWYALIADHPGVSHRTDLPVDRHYLSHFCTEPFGTAEIDRYHGWFPRPVGTIVGEWTPGYLAHPWVGALITRAAPEARILVTVRDPVDRLQRALVRRGVHRGDDIGWHVADAVDRGLYAAQLRQLFKHVEAERVLVLQYERCVEDPAAALRTTYRFLGLDDAHQPPSALLRRRAPGGSVGDLDAETTRRLVDLYAADVADLSRLVPDLDLSRWPHFAKGGDGTQ